MVLKERGLFQKYENPANPYNRKPHRKALDKCSNNRPTQMIWESQCLFLKRTRKDRRHFIEQQNTNILQIKLILVFKKLILKL